MSSPGVVAVSVGDVFGRWVITCSERNSLKVACRCECGAHKSINVYNLIAGKSTSCGCGANYGSGVTTHGLSSTPTYKTWKAMKARCYQQSHKNFSDYGGRGVKVCERWLNNAADFIADMGERPSSLHSIDRINSNGDYEPSNCRWVTQKEQMRNTRRSSTIEHEGRTMTVAAWADELGVLESTLHHRLYAGWSAKDTIEKPVRKIRRAHTPVDI